MSKKFQNDSTTFFVIKITVKILLKIRSETKKYLKKVVTHPGVFSIVIWPFFENGICSRYHSLPNNRVTNIFRYKLFENIMSHIFLPYSICTFL